MNGSASDFTELSISVCLYRGTQFLGFLKACDIVFRYFTECDCIEAHSFWSIVWLLPAAKKYYHT